MVDINNNVFLHEITHFSLTSLIAIFFWLRFKDKRLILAAFLFGFLIDIDHWFDYFSYFGPVINLKNFFDVTTYVHQSGKTFIPLHGWEYLIIFWLIGKYIGKKFKIKVLEWVITFAYLAHLLWDNFSFSHHPLAYSFIFRLINNFSLKSFSGF